MKTIGINCLCSTSVSCFVLELCSISSTLSNNIYSNLILQLKNKLPHNFHCGVRFMLVATYDSYCIKFELGNGRKQGHVLYQNIVKEVNETFWNLLYTWSIQVSETVLCVGGVSIIEPLGKVSVLRITLILTYQELRVVIELWVKLNKIHFKMLWMWIVGTFFRKLSVYVLCYVDLCLYIYSSIHTSLQISSKIIYLYISLMHTDFSVIFR